MKLHIVFLLSASWYLAACTSGHKPSETSKPDSLSVENTLGNQQLEIDKYVNAIKGELPKLEYKRSLRYNLGDFSFDVSVYYKNNKEVALIEDGHRGEFSYRRLNIYLKGDKPVFAELNEKTSMGSNNQFVEVKIYLDSGLKVLKAVERKSDEENKLANLPFSSFTPDTSGFAFKAAFLKRALDRSGEFDLPFYEIKQDKNIEYLVLGKNEEGSYWVNLQIVKEDSVIKRLKMNQSQFKGKRLDVEWEYENIKGYERLVYKNGKLPNESQLN
ncbi:hypothetical protein [Solitalea lacus]|uniref:hypothetical protein n=1 Tax=Solitalea lacus TaxID=2911172 RepID=UPI001EDBEBAC|nr:hypothetical protein [Solitalea lacus]UKJ06155.1 hypothetical protein L2B55_11455 [Solitalea lacus]